MSTSSGIKQDKPKVLKRKIISKPTPVKKAKVFRQGIRKSGRVQAKSKFKNTCDEPVDVTSEEQSETSEYSEEDENSFSSEDDERENSSDAPSVNGTESDGGKDDHISYYYSSTSINDHNVPQPKDLTGESTPHDLPHRDSISKWTEVILNSFLIAFSKFCHYI